MAYFELNDSKKIYYEEYGQGRPLVVLNGIMMSCASWAEFVEPFSANNHLILVDFLDQGKSDRMDGPYDQSIQVEVVKGLLDHLGLEKACVMGLSYGGEVALQFAIQYPQHVERLLLCNTTARTGPWLGDIGDAWNLAAADPDAYYLTTIPVIYSPGFYVEKNDWMNRRRKALHPIFSDKRFIEAIVRLTNSSRNYDVRDKLGQITAPTLVVSGQQDYLTPLEEQIFICEHIPNSHHVILPHCGHCSTYEHPLLFTALVLGFCNTVKTEFAIV